MSPLVRVALFTTAAGFVGPAEAEMLRLVQPDRFQEEFAGGADVSGELLAGLAYSPVAADLDLAALSLHYPENAADGQICIKLTTSDGRYWAQNAYAGEPADEPAAIPVPTRYEDQLKAYRTTDLLTLASSGPCDGERGALVPVRLAPKEDADVLVAYVNVNRGDVGATLEQDGEVIASDERCDRPTSSHVAYSRICVLPIGDGMGDGAVSLHLHVTSLTGGGLARSYALGN